MFGVPLCKVANSRGKVSCLIICMHWEPQYRTLIHVHEESQGKESVYQIIIFSLCRGQRSWKRDTAEEETELGEQRLGEEDTTVQHISSDNLHPKAVNVYIHSFTAVSNYQGFSLWGSRQISSYWAPTVSTSLLETSEWI